jgi:hypothetical protein
MPSIAVTMTTKQGPVESKQICRYFFNEISHQAWRRKKCGKNKSKNGGWTNLLNHLRTCIGDEYRTVYCNARQENGLNEFVLRISNTEKEMFEWIEFLVMKNLPVGFVDYSQNYKIEASINKNSTSKCPRTFQGATANHVRLTS